MSLSLEAGSPRSRGQQTGFLPGLLPGPHTAALPRALSRWGETGSSLLSFLTRAPILGLTLMTASNPDQFPKARLPAASHWGVRATTCEFGGDTKILSRTGVVLCGSAEPGGAAWVLLTNTWTRDSKPLKGESTTWPPDSDTEPPTTPSCLHGRHHWGLRASSQEDLTGLRVLLTWPPQAFQ